MAHTATCTPFVNAIKRSTLLHLQSRIPLQLNHLYPRNSWNILKYDPALDHELAPFLLRLPPTPEFTKYFGQLKREFLGSVLSVPSDRSDRSEHPRTIGALVVLIQRLWRDIRYLIRLEPGVQPPEETIQLASGSCRDSAWLLCQLLRHLGFAARFVRGCLIQLTADVKSLDGPSGPPQDLTDLHAWCEVYLPGAGWIGLDPSSGLLADEGHIPLACAPEPSSAAPITGLVHQCECDFSHDARVTRIFESPRVTNPYTEEQWREIESLGHQLDAELQRHGCRLTMGGEPTFVSIDDMDGAEWNTLALGPTKRAPPTSSSASSAASPPARCCTTARANGIRASRCRAGPSAVTGARTASPSGSTRSFSPTSPGNTLSVTAAPRNSLTPSPRDSPAAATGAGASSASMA